jgi:hypothetical protein
VVRDTKSRSAIAASVRWVCKYGRKRISAAVNGEGPNASPTRSRTDAGAAPSGLGISSCEADSSETLCEEPLVMKGYYALGGRTDAFEQAPSSGGESSATVKQSCAFREESVSRIRIWVVIDNRRFEQTT